MKKDNQKRNDGRMAASLRPIRIQADIAPAAMGSVLISFGRTQVICAVTIEETVPRWMREQKVGGGWLSAEYSLLPYSTRPRSSREVNSGRVGGRTQEIQRLIGRSLRAVVDLDKLGARTIWIDCDVLQADGGTRTAAITGAYTALHLAVQRCLREKILAENPIKEAVAAISVGVFKGRVLLDLCYEEDAAADVDMNIVMTSSGRFVEVQGTAEDHPFSKQEMERMLALAKAGITSLFKAQKKAIAS